MIIMEAPKHHVVYLEAGSLPPRELRFPHTKTAHAQTLPHQVAERIKDATIVITAVVPITKEDLSYAPLLECVSITATGCEWLDREAFASRGVTVVNCPQSNVEAVGEHFLALYFSSRKKIVEIHGAVTGPGREWVKNRGLMSLWKQGPPLSCREETLGIIGYGGLGSNIKRLATAVGFGEVIIAERKGASTAREGRVLFEDMIKRATTIVVCCPKDASTTGLISEPEFSMMKPEALLINISKGGVVCERALAQALRDEIIFGAATDVLETEPGGRGTTPLIPDSDDPSQTIPNLTITSHLAWFSQTTIDNLYRMLKEGVEGFVAGSILDDQTKRLVVTHQGQIFK